jgi:hypothetical protein
MKLERYLEPLDMSRKGYETVLYLAILGWVCVLFVMADGWGFKDILFPRAVAVITGALVVVKLVSLHRSSFGSFLPQDSDTSELTDSIGPNGLDDEAQKRDVLSMIAWTVSFPIFLYLFGYFYIVPLYLFTFIWYYVGSMRFAAKVSAVFSILMYVIFVEFLQFSLWEGVYEILIPV